MPKLLPEPEQRRQAFELVLQIATASAGKLDDSQEARFRRLEEILSIDALRDTGSSPVKPRG